MSENQRYEGIKEVPAGKIFRGTVMVRSTVVRYRSSGEAYLVLEVGDRSGRLKGRIWQQPLRYARFLSAGQVVDLEAQIELFRNAKTFRLRKLKIRENCGPQEWKALLPTGRFDHEKLAEKIRLHICEITSPFWQALLDQLLIKSEQTLNALLHAPAGKLWHYNYLHGLAEQTLHLLQLADTLRDCFPLIDRELLKTGILCRAVGFAEAFTLAGYIDYGDEARLSGIIPLAYLKVSEAIKKIDAFPEERRQCVLHLVAFSCEDGHLVHPDYVVPKTPEAIALAALLRLVRNVNAVTRIALNDIPPNSRWSKHVNLLNRSIFVGDKWPGHNHD